MFFRACRYTQDPSGWQLQYDGSFSHPPPDMWKSTMGTNCYDCCMGHAPPAPSEHDEFLAASVAAFLAGEHRN